MYNTIEKVKQSPKDVHKVFRTVHSRVQSEKTSKQNKKLMKKENSSEDNIVKINKTKKKARVLNDQNEDQLTSKNGSHVEKSSFSSKKYVKNHVFHDKKNKINPYKISVETPNTVTLTPDVQENSELICSPKLKWYSEEKITFSGEKIERKSVEDLYIQANQYLELEEKKYNTSSHISSSDKHFFENVMKSGTSNDKISALALSIQESPLHSSRKMKILLNMTKKKSRTQIIQSVEALKDLFISTILPDRKLKYFKQQDFFDSENMTKKQLILWAFEDFLKRYYFEYLEILENLLKNPLSFLRIRILTCVFELIKDKPEQEQNLLRLLVNKLGDSEKKVASKTSYCILQLATAHPAMKDIIISEIEKLLFRSSISQHAQYYSMITLNQMVLSSKTINIANHLINIYFLFFTKLMKSSQNVNDIKKSKNHEIFQKTEDNSRELNKNNYNVYEKEMNSKLILAIISGINRALPFSKIDEKIFDNHINTLFLIVHNINFNTSIQALILIFQISKSKEAILDRFYRTLYESIQDFRLFNSSKQTMYLNLLFKAIKTDINKTRVKSFVKRLIQTASMHQVAFVSGIMILLNELEKIHPEIGSLYNRYQNYAKKRTDFTKVLGENKNESFMKDNKNVSNLSDSLDKYDACKRNPCYTNVDNTYLWELIPFLHHFHPTISLYTKSLLHGHQIISKPDISFYTLSHFLDKFVYRNPKIKTVSHDSVIHPISKESNKNTFFLAKSETYTSEPLNKESFVNQEISQISPDEIFYYKYFYQKHKQAANKKKTVKLSKDDFFDSVNENSDYSESIEDDLEKDEPIYNNDSDNQEFDEDCSDFNESENDLISSDDFSNADQMSVNESTDKTSVTQIGLKRKLNGKKDYFRAKKIKQLPVFAPVEEYSSILED
ncbi:hypothetical protein PORY_002266 [Pneumocystis oryctolagi]|uniref:Uncharacterized protein n=1 Tax=Pneumocystis oryctolagi TaxID=42067 RepID=A0ACB7C9C1_9ASCO|nr:hypothetical protein PORY_002266 [Pneumocystis oryctolagi]